MATNARMTPMRLSTSMRMFPSRTSSLAGLGQVSTDVIEAIDRIGQVGFDHRHGHAVDDTTGLVLCPDLTADLLEHPRALATVGAHAGQHHGKDPVAIGFGRGTEGDIDTGLVVEALVTRQDLHHTARD